MASWVVVTQGPQPHSPVNRQTRLNTLPFRKLRLRAVFTHLNVCVTSFRLLQVIIVGLVRTVNEQATRLEYLIDDMTGPPLQVRQFLETDVSSPNDFLFVNVKY